MTIALHRLTRVAIVGTSCSGKSTLARTLAAALKVPHIELDASYWGPNWRPVDAQEFRRRVDYLTSQPRWVCDGNYSGVRDLVWQRAESVVWLNYSLPLVMTRALRRTLKRCISGSRLFSGNRESFRLSFLSRDSILLWVIRTHRARQVEFPKLFTDNRHAHLYVVELRGRSDARCFLAAVRAAVTQVAS
jgi:adenylate kinase family enzyme